VWEDVVDFDGCLVVVGVLGLVLGLRGGWDDDMGFLWWCVFGGFCWVVGRLV